MALATVITAVTDRKERESRRWNECRNREPHLSAFYTTKGIGGPDLGLWTSYETTERHCRNIKIQSTQRPGANPSRFCRPVVQFK